MAIMRSRLIARPPGYWAVRGRRIQSTHSRKSDPITATAPTKTDAAFELEVPKAPIPTLTDIAINAHCTTAGGGIEPADAPDGSAFGFLGR